MKLDELSCENLFDEEDGALSELPLTQQGMLELLSYLESFDSLNAYQFLFDHYSELMSTELRAEWSARYYRLFDDPPPI